MPATISSCLNSCGLCGSAYQARVQPGGHQEVAGALGGGAGQRRGLDLDEVVPASTSRMACVDLRAQPERRVLARTPQVEVAVLQPGVLADGVRSSIWNGSGAAGLSTSSSRIATSTSPVGMVGLAFSRGRASTTPVTWMQNSLRRLVADDHLADSGGVPQIDEGDPAVVAPLGDPPARVTVRSGRRPRSSPMRWTEPASMRCWLQIRA
jgi:hypothetical protein